jgi:hypothetical protein
MFMHCQEEIERDRERRLRETGTVREKQGKVVETWEVISYKLTCTYVHKYIFRSAVFQGARDSIREMKDYVS